MWVLRVVVFVGMGIVGILWVGSVRCFVCGVGSGRLLVGEVMRVLSVRVPDGFWDRCAAMAVGRGLGLSEWVCLVLWEALEAGEVES